MRARAALPSLVGQAPGLPSRLLCGAVVAVAAVASGCGGSTSPTPFGLPGQTNTGASSLSGRLISYGDRAPISGATVIMSGTALVTDADGGFTFSNVPDNGGAGLTTSPAGFLFRGLALRVGGTRNGVEVDVIRDAPPFDLAFYRQFVRGGLGGNALLETRPWTVDPSFYARTVTEDAGSPVPADVIASIGVMIGRSVPELSGGRRQMAAFESGPEAREERDGWVRIVFYEQPPNGVFGTSTVGGNVGTILLRYPIAVSNATTNPYNCSTPTLAIADHEITHTMGYWHTVDVFADTFSGPDCPGAPRPDRTRYHAGIMYARPPGNRDPDVDPAEILQSTAPPAPSRRDLVLCTFLGR